MIVDRNKKLGTIHIAKKQLRLTDSEYAACLAVAGVSSAADIKTEMQYQKILTALKARGFVQTVGAAYNFKRRLSGGSENPAMISPRQAYYIRGLWALASRARDEASLRAIVARIAKVDDISFLTKAQAAKVILCLRDICSREGYNPDLGRRGEITCCCHPMRSRWL